MLVETDLVRRLGQVPGSLSRAATLTVGELVRPAPELPSTARASEAARAMSPRGCDAVLVVDDRHLLGIVTATDLLRMLARRAR